MIATDKTLALGSRFRASVRTGDSVCYGEIIHVEHNVWTEIAHYYVRNWSPGPFNGIAEGIAPHVQIACYVREHKLSPDPETIAKQLLAALIQVGKVAEPIFLSWRWYKELGGLAKGTVYDPD
ncbi:MAG: hypothetical protein HYZ40_11170 [Rhodospirillales bacterium]|nr:hypothetical protein [Rhodospirillales bacterium]